MPFIEPTTWRPSGVDDLEPNAWDVLRHPGSASVIAGPGAGKTELLAQRATFLLQTGICAPPYRILAISFKRDAAQALADRVRQRCPPHQASRFTSMTFDALTKSLVDRFFPAIPPAWRTSQRYMVAPPSRNMIEEFLDHTLRQAPREWRDEINGLSASHFESAVVGPYRLPLVPHPPTTGCEFAILRWWDAHLRATPTSLTFVCLNRLAELLLRANPQIRRAVQLSFPFVFVDEFQDTTYAQYDFLHAAFAGARTVVTAVGDDKQRIMVWAGAQPDAVSQFETGFQARRIALLFNFRSCPELVRIQHIVARALDAGVDEAQSRARRAVEGDVAQVWTFADAASEATQIAAWLRSDMQRRGKQPRDYALLVRQQADRFEQQLAQPFVAAGLQLRNESKRLGRTSLQDLLSEEITHIALALLRLGTRRRDATSWATASKALFLLHAYDPDDVTARQRVEQLLRPFLRDLRLTMVVPPSATAATVLLDRIFAFLDLGVVAQAFLEYSHGDDLAIAAEALRLHLEACADEATSWGRCLDQFEGVGQVPLMTIHKSKGLEYDTIVCVGLDDRMWRQQDAERTATFFVALSRAKQRAIFTYCQSRGSRTGVADLYALLTRAGVPELPF
jgi:superfamily I DNA/RNA helicase